MDEVVLSREDFKAFSSDTRASIAKLLKKRNYTLSELSKRLGMASPTVKTHLDKLARAKIVQQLDEGRKWKYYALTRKGKRLLEPEGQPGIMVVIGIAAIALVGVIFLLSQSMPLGLGPIEALKGSAASAPSYSAGQAAQGQIQNNLAESGKSAIIAPKENVPGFVFLAIMLAFVLGYFIARMRAKQGKKW